MVEMLRFIRPIGYKILIDRVNSLKPSNDDDTYTMEYEEHFDKNNKEHLEAIEYFKGKIENFNNMISSNASLNKPFEFEENNGKILVRYNVTSRFETIANSVSMEFLSYGSLGKMTMLDLIGFATSAIVATMDQENKTSESIDQENKTSKTQSTDKNNVVLTRQGEKELLLSLDPNNPDHISAYANSLGCISNDTARKMLIMHQDDFKKQININ